MAEEQKRTQGEILESAMAGKTTAELLALIPDAAELSITEEKIFAWRDNDRAMSSAHQNAVAKALKMDLDTTLELQKAAAELKAALAQGPAEQAVPVKESPVAEEAAPAANAAAPEEAAPNGKELRVAAGRALTELMRATPLSAAELKRRSGNGDGERQREVKVQYVLVPDLEARLAQLKDKKMRLSKQDLRQRTGNGDHMPNIRITEAEANTIVDVLAQSVQGNDKAFNKAANAFSKAVAAAQSAWDQHEAQETARLAEAEKARAARRAEAGKHR